MTLYANYTWINQLRAKVKWGSPLAVILSEHSDSLNQLRREQSYVTRTDTEKESIPTVTFFSIPLANSCSLQTLGQEMLL